MGIDCRITLPSDVRVRDVASVIAILAGHEKEWVRSGKATWMEVARVKVLSTEWTPSCAVIDLYDNNGKIYHHVLFHFEWDDSPDKGLLPGSSTFWRNIGYGLIQFFGGSIDFDDCDRSEQDAAFKCPRDHNNPSNDKAWDRFQQELDNLQPIPDVETAQHYPDFE